MAQLRLHIDPRLTPFKTRFVLFLAFQVALAVASCFVYVLTSFIHSIQGLPTYSLIECVCIAYVGWLVSEIKSNYFDHKVLRRHVDDGTVLTAKFSCRLLRRLSMTLSIRKYLMLFDVALLIAVYGWEGNRVLTVMLLLLCLSNQNMFDKLLNLYCKLFSNETNN